MNVCTAHEPANHAAAAMTAAATTPTTTRVTASTSPRTIPDHLHEDDRPVAGRVTGTVPSTTDTHQEPPK